MTKLWAVYGTVDHRARQVLVLTQLTDDAPAATDEPINVVEWNDGGPEAEARGSTPDPVQASGVSQTRDVSGLPRARAPKASTTRRGRSFSRRAVA